MPELSEAERDLVRLAVNGAAGELRELVEVRVPELVAYQDEGYARRYAEFVRRVHVAEQERAPGHTELTETVARHLFKLMAYKDEYEVARLHLDAVEQAKLEGRVRHGRRGQVHAPPAAAAGHGARPQAQARPLVRAGLPDSCGACAAARHAARPVRPRRGTPGRARADREYEDTIAEALALLTPDTHATALELSSCRT